MHLNYDISVDETEAVLQILKKGKARGPDEVFTDMINMAGKSPQRLHTGCFKSHGKMAKSLTDEKRQALNSYVNRVKNPIMNQAHTDQSV